MWVLPGNCSTRAVVIVCAAGFGGAYAAGSWALRAEDGNEARRALKDIGGGPIATLTEEWNRARKMHDKREEVRVDREIGRLRASGVEPISDWEDGQQTIRLSCDGRTYQLRVVEARTTSRGTPAKYYYYESGEISRSRSVVRLIGKAAYTSASPGFPLPSVIDLSAHQDPPAQNVHYVPARNGPWRTLNISETGGDLGLRMGWRLLRYTGHLAPHD